MANLTQLRKEAREGILHVVQELECSCGVGQPRGSQCNCGYEVKLSTHLTHKWIDTLIDKVVEAVEESVVKDFHCRMSGFGGEKIETSHYCPNCDNSMTASVKRAFTNFKK